MTYELGPSNYACPDCNARLDARDKGPGGMQAFECPHCEYARVFDPAADEFPLRILEAYKPGESENVSEDFTQSNDSLPEGDE